MPAFASVLTRSGLNETVWGNEYDGMTNVLDVSVNYLRNKLEAAGGAGVSTPSAA